MKKYLMIFSCLFVMIFITASVSAADAYIYTDTNDAVLLTIGNDGTGNFTGDIMENSVKLSETYCALAGGCDLEGPVFITGSLNITGNLNVSGILTGDGSGLTGVTAVIADNSTLIAYQNVTNFPTCAGDTYFQFDGTDLTCVAIPDDTVQIDAANVTAGTFDVARIPTLVNQTTVAYQNVTNLPTCGANEFFSFDGADLTCVAATSVMDYTNLALTNVTNIFVPEQNFTGGINSADNINLASAKSLAWDDGGSITATAGVITFKAGV